MEIISSRTNSLADATMSTLGDKTKAEHIQSLRRQAANNAKTKDMAQ